VPHQCVRCSRVFPDGAQEILKGCSCGARLFFFIKKKHITEGKELISNLSIKDKEQIEKDVCEISNVKHETRKPVILDFESIRILRPGKYELDIVSLFKKNPLVFKLSEGKYVIDLPQAFDNKK